MNELDTAQDPQGPRGSSVPTPQGGGQQFPLIPPAKDQYDTEHSLTMLRNALYQRSQEIDVEYMQHVAAQGQLQAYDAQRMQEASGQDVEQEMALLSNGLSMTNVRMPQSRSAYEGWFADLESRMATRPGGVHPGWPGVKDRYQGMQELAGEFDSNKRMLSSALERQLASFRSPMRAPMESVGQYVSSGTAGLIPALGSRAEELGKTMKANIDRLVPEPPAYDIGTRRDADPGMAGRTKPTPRDQRADEKARSMRKLLQEEAFDQVRKAVSSRGEATESGTNLFMQQVASVLGIVTPMAAAEKVGVKAVQGLAGAAKSGVGKVIEHLAGATIGFAGLGATQAPNEEQRRRIETLPPEKQAAAESAAHIENAVTMGLTAPLWVGGGALGSAVGRAIGSRVPMVPKVLGERMGAGLGVGAVFPAVGEIESEAKAGAMEASPQLRKLVEERLIAKPELQGPVRQMIVSVGAGDWTSFKDGLKRYAKEAAPGLVAFGSLAVLGSIGAAKLQRNQKAAQEMLSYVDELEAQAKLEATKVAKDDKPLEQELHRVIDEKVDDIKVEAQGEPTRQSELADRVGPQAAAEKVRETLDIAETEPTPKPVPTMPEGAKPGGGRSKEERLLRKALKTADPETAAKIQEQLAELRGKREKSDVEAGIRPAEAAKPKDYASAMAERMQEQLAAKELVDNPPAGSKLQQRQANSAKYEKLKASRAALRYRELARKTQDPKVRAAAEHAATEHESHMSALSTWEATGGVGPEPAFPRGAERLKRAADYRNRVAVKNLLTDAQSGVPAPERVAAQHLAYEGSERQKIDQADAAGKVEPGHVLEIEGKQATVTEVTKTEARVEHEDGSRERVPLEEGSKKPAGSKITKRGAKPKAEPEPVQRAIENIEEARSTGEPAKKEDVQEVVEAQTQAQQEASGVAEEAAPSTKKKSGAKKSPGSGKPTPSADPAEAASLIERAKTKGTGTAGIKLVEQAELVTGEPIKPSAHAKDAPTVPPRMETQSTAPAATKAAEVAELETVASHIAGRERSIYTMLAELKRDASRESTEEARSYAEVAANNPSMHPLEAEFAKFVSEHAKLAGTKRGPRFAAEMLYEFLRNKFSLPADKDGRSFGEITEQLGLEVRGIEKVAQNDKNLTQFHQWAALNSQQLTGLWSVVARYFPAGKKVLSRIQMIENGRMGPEAGAYYPLWPVMALKAGWRMWSQYRADNFSTLMEQMTREPARHKSGWRHLGPIGDFLEMPSNWLGHMLPKGAKAISEARAQLGQVNRDFFDDVTGILRKDKVPQGSQKSHEIFRILDGQKPTQNRVIARARAGDAEARDTLQRALKVRKWLRQVRDIIVEWHPRARRLRESIEFVDSDVQHLLGRESEYAARKAGATAWGIGDPAVRAGHQRILALKEMARHLYGGLRNPKSTGAPIRKPKRGMQSLPYADILREHTQLEADRARAFKAAGHMAPEQINRILRGIQRSRRTAETHLDFLKHDLKEFQDTFGIKDYIKHSYEFEIHPTGPRALVKRAKQGMSSYEARRQFVNETVMRRKDALKAKGLVEEDVVRAMWRYTHSVVPYIYRSRFLHEIESTLYGKRQRLTPKEIARGRTSAIYGDSEGMVLGLHSPVAVQHTTKAGRVVQLTSFARPKKGTPHSPSDSVLMWFGEDKDAPSKTQLANPKWVSKHLRSDRNPNGGLLQLTKRDAFHGLSSYRGGWWELADMARRGDMVKFVNRVTGGMGELTTGIIGQEWGVIHRSFHRVARALASWTSSMTLGGLQLHNPLNNVLSATFMNHFFLGGPMHGEAIKGMSQFFVRAMREHGRAAAEMVTRKGAETTPQAVADPEQLSLSKTWDKFRTPQEQLAKMAPAKRAAQELRDDAMVAMLQSGILGENHTNPTFGMSRSDIRDRVEYPRALHGPWQEAKPQAHFEAGQLVVEPPTKLDKLKAGYRNVTGQLRLPANAVKGAWWAAFQASELYARAPAFMHGYVTARSRGLNHSQALAEGLSTTHMLQMVYNQVTKSDFLNSAVGTLMGNLSQWTMHAAGRLTALPLTKQIAYAGMSASVIVMMHKLLGQDVIDVFGTRVGNIPVVGEKLEDIAFGLGTATKDDPQGLRHKGPLYDGLGLRTLPIPFPMPTQFGPSVQLIENAIKSLWHTRAGNGELAALYFQRAVRNIDPMQSAFARHLDKAFGQGNKPQPDGTSIYVPRASGKGSTVLEHTGWLEYFIQQLPGTRVMEAQQWLETRLAGARGAALQTKQREMTELGLDWARAYDEKKTNPASAQVEADLRKQIQGMAKDLDRELNASDWRSWHERARFEGETDARMRSVLASPSKEAKGRELAELLRDPNYPLSQERATELLRKLGGQGGFGAWLNAADMDPRVKKEVQEAWNLRKHSWGK